MIAYFKRKQLEYWFHTGLATLENGLYERALKFGKKMVAHYPEFSGGYDVLASALEGLGKPDTALKTLEEAVIKAPKSYILWEKLGLQHSEREQYSQAIECFDKAIVIEPKVESLYYNKAVSLANLQQLYEALACLETLINLNDEFFSAYILQASILNRLGALAQEPEPINQAIERMEVLKDVKFERFGVSNRFALLAKVYENLIHSYLLKGEEEKAEALETERTAILEKAEKEMK